jgi:gliding motility-associated-like protein
MRLRFLILFAFFFHLFTVLKAQQSGVLVISGNAPLHINACGDNETFQIQIYNPTPFHIQAIGFTLILPNGIEYQAATISGATETSISNLNQPIFTIAGIAPQSFHSISYQAKANCSGLTQSANGIPFQNTALFNFNLYNVAFTENYQTTFYTLLQPNLSITTSTNTAFSANIGSIFTRCFTITNGGTGRLSELLFKDLHGAGIQVTAVNTGLWTSNNNTEEILLNAAHFTLNGNGDGYLDPNESITICETITVNNCNGVASAIEVSWGCNNENCQVFNSTANIVFPALTPNLVFTPSQTQSSCFGMGAPNEQSLLIRNTGIGIARNIEMEIFQAVNNNTYNILRSYIDISSIQIKYGNGSYNYIWPDSVTMLPSFPCFDGNSGAGRFWLKIDSLSANDSIRIKWNVFSCCITSCNESSKYINGWQYKGKFKNDCTIEYTIPSAWGKSNFVSARTFFEFNSGPISIGDGETKRFNFLITQYSNTYPISAGNHWRFKIIKNQCLDYVGNLRIINANGINVWNPSSVYMSGDTIIGIFNGNPPFTLNNAEVMFDLKANCQNCASAGMGNVEIQSWIIPSGSCGCESNVSCYSIPVEIICPQTCDGFNMTSFSTKRINFDQPDNNNDGLPDAPPATINMNMVRADRATFGDTILALYTGVIKSFNPNSSWDYLFAITRISNMGIVFTISDIQLEVYRNNTASPDFISNQIAFIQNDSVNSRRFILNISASQMQSTGSFPQNFLYLNNDSIVIKAKYVISTNTLPNLISCIFSNDIFCSNTNNAFALDKYGCNNFKDYISYIGYNNDDCCVDNSVVNGCDTITISQIFRQKVGPSATIFGGNYFRSEFRNFSHIQQVRVIKPAGYKYIDATFRQTRTAGTNGSNASPLYNVNPVNILSDTLIFNVAHLHSVNGGPIPLSDEGYTGTLSIRYAPTCINPPTINQSINYTGTFAPAPKLINSPTSLVTATTTDNVAHMQAVLVLQSPAPNLLALDNTVTWQINLSNNSNRNAANTWIAIPQTGNLTIVEVRNIANNQLINPVNGIYQLGNLTPNALRQISIKASYNSCLSDSILVATGWNCNSYPQNLNAIICTSTTIKLKLFPQQPNLTTLIHQLSNNNSICDTSEVLIEGVNMQLGTSYNLQLQFSLPPGVSFINNSAQIKYPVNAAFSGILNPAFNNGMYSWNISQLQTLIQNDGIKGVLDTLKNKVQIKFKVITDCNYSNGSTMDAAYLAISACGIQTGNTVFYSTNFANTIDTSSYLTSINLSGDFITSCGNPNEINVSIRNNGPQIFGNNDSIHVYLPGGISYQNASFIPLYNAPINTNPVTSTQNNFTKLSWKLPAGVIASDSSCFKFYITGNPDSLNCRVYPVYAQSSMQKIFYCGTTNQYCNTNAITGSDSLWLYSYKSFITVQNVQGYSIPDLNGELAFVTTELFNFGDSVVPPNTITISFYADVDANGQLSAGDLLLHHEPINSLIPGNGNQSFYNSSFNIPAGYACNLLAVIDTSINNCACMPWELAFNIPLKAAGTDTSLCSSNTGVSLQLGSVSINGYQYNWLPAVYLDNVTIANPLLTTPPNNLTIDSLTYILTVDRNGCSSSDTLMIVQYPYNFAYAGSDTSICNINQLQLNADAISPLSSGNWSAVPFLNFSNTNGTNTLASGFTNGLNQAIWEVSNAYCPSNFDTLTIYYYSLPNVFAGNDTVLCGQSAINLSGQVSPISATVYWQNISNNAFITDSLALNSFLINLENDTYSIVLNASNGMCPLVSDTIIIQNYIAPFVNAGSDTSLCAAYQITVNADNPINYTNINWSALPGGISITNGNSLSPTFSNLTEGVFQFILSVENSTCYQLTDTIELAVYDMPNAYAGNDTSLCDAAQLGLNASALSGSAQGEWHQISGANSLSFSNSNQNTAVISNLDYDNYVLVWQVSNGICPLAYDTISISNFAAINLSSLSNIEVCDSSSVFLQASPVPSGAWGWWNQLSGNSCTIQDSTNYQTLVYGLTAGNYSYQWNVSNGGFCPDKSVVLNVSVYNSPSAFAGNDIQLCIPASTTLSGSFSPATSNYWWSVINNNLPYTFSDSTLANPLFTPSAEGLYSLLWNVQNGNCAIKTDTINVTTFMQPVAMAVSPISACDTTMVLLQASPVLGNATGLWILEQGHNLIFSNPTNNQSFAQNLQAGNYSVYWIVSNGACPSDTALVNISIYNKPAFSYAISDTILCSGNCTEIQFAVTPDSGDAITLALVKDRFNATYAINNIQKICPEKIGMYNFQVLVNTQQQCVLDTFIHHMFTVNPAPVAAFSVNPDSAFITHPVFTFYNLSELANYLEWNFGDNSLLLINENQPVHSYTDTGTYQVSLLAKNEFGCSDTAFKLIRVKDEFAIYIPNAFTPNGDFDNPTFGAKGVGITEFEMLIFNRWGELIFSSDNINAQWDGTYQNSESPQGVYTYIINLKSISGRSYNYAGHFTLIR